MEFNKVIEGDCLEVLKELPDEIVDCCVTSPPYYALRDYGTGKWVGGDPNCPHYRTSKYSKNTATGHKAMMEQGEAVADAIYKTVCPLCGAVRVDKQIGLEETPEQYVEKLVKVFHEVKRVLKDDGTLWLNIGDSYAAQRGGSHQPAETLGGGKHGKAANGETVNRGRNAGYSPSRNASAIGLKHKDLIGIPWLLAFALRNDGWFLRQDIIWAKPNPMPESVKDRCTKSHEYIFLMSKSPKYYFDYEAIQEKAISADIEQYNHGEVDIRFGGSKYGDERRAEGLQDEIYMVRNKRDVWNVATQPVKEAHFATFPEKLIEPCILAGCRVGGVVLDPFFGSGTTGRVCVGLNRQYLGIELNPEYIEISEKRTNNVQLSMAGMI